MKAAILRRAAELGFDDGRVTTAGAPESAGQFRSWLAGGRNGEMGYLARNAHKRVDPQQVLPGARSIIALAVSYEGPRPIPPGPGPFPRVPVSQPASPPAAHLAGIHGGAATFSSGLEGQGDSSGLSTGLVARYARFADYHDVLGERLRNLTELVNRVGGVGTRSLWYVDTGPVLERDLAQRAGLGFIGKHTNLISRRLGNWIFLSEIITTLELEPDAPERNHCGTCTRCVAACPTAAIIAPFELDARRCISYLTIELKGAIPPELRPAVGNRIYGCDDCLAVCPWNRFAHEGRMLRAHARGDFAQPDLIGLLRLSEADFKRRFEGTPIFRTKRKGLLRNVCVALGNVGDGAALPALAQAATDPEPLIVEHAVWAMQQIERRQARAMSAARSD